MSENLKKLGLKTKKEDGAIHIWDDWQRIYLTMPDASAMANGCVDAEHFWIRVYARLARGGR